MARAGRTLRSGWLAGSSWAALGLLVVQAVIDVAARSAVVSSPIARLAACVGVVAAALLIVVAVGDRMSASLAWPGSLVAAVSSSAASIVRAAVGVQFPVSRPVAPLQVVALVAAAWLSRRLMVGCAPRVVARRAGEVLLTVFVLSLAALSLVDGTAPSPLPVRAGEWIAVGAGAMSVVLVVTSGSSASRRPRLRPTVAAVSVLAAVLVERVRESTGPMLASSVWPAVATLLVLVWVMSWVADRGWIDRAAVRARSLWRQLLPAGRRSTRSLGSMLGSVRRTVVGGDADDPPLEHELSNSDRGWAWVIVTISVLTIVVDVVSAVRIGAQSIGHGATVATRAWDVGTVDTPLVGMPTGLTDHRLGLETHHPGPLLFYLLSPAVRLGGTHLGAFVGASLISLGGWLFATWAAFRAGGRWAALCAWVGGAVIANVVIRDLTFEPLNVFVVCLALFAVPLLCWAAATGTSWALPWAVVLATLNLQAYLPHGLVAVVPVVWAFTVVVQRSSNPTDRTGSRRALVWSGLLAAVLWVPPLVEAVGSAGGNVRALWAGITTEQATIGVSGLWVAPTWAMALPPAWGRLDRVFAATPGTYLGGEGLAGGLVLLAMAVGMWVTRHRTPSALRRLWVVFWLSLVSAGVAVVRLPIERTPFYQLTWLGVVSVFGWFVAAVLMRHLLDVQRSWRWPRSPSVRTGVAVLCVVAVAAVGLVPSSLSDVRGPYWVVDLELPTLTAAALEHTRPGQEVLVANRDGLEENILADGIIAELISHDREVWVPPFDSAYYGRRRVERGDWTGQGLVVVNGATPTRPNGVRIARAEPSNWSADRFEAAAQRLRSLAAVHDLVLARPVDDPAVRSAVARWFPAEDCDRFARFLAGELPLADLPIGALAQLYIDDLVVEPRLPDDEADSLMETLTFAPVELWDVDVESPIDQPVGDSSVRPDGICAAP